MRLTMWRYDEEMLHPVDAAAQRHDVRSRLFLRVEELGVVGFGEIDPQPFALNGDPSLLDVVRELDDVLLAQVVGAREREGSVPSWTRIARFAGPRPASAPAVCLVEMALLDRELRSEGRGIAELWPQRFETPAQATVSLLAEEEWSVPATTARVRAKTAPGPVASSALRRLEALGVPVMLDFNCSATSDADVLDQLEQLAGFVDVTCVEQPYAAGNVVDHARLAEQVDIPLSIDEGVRTVRDLGQIARYRAARVVCVKPARVGGYANARTIIERAKDLGLTPYLGGFFESPFARTVNRMLAEHCVSEPSDIAVVATSTAPTILALEAAEGGFGVRPSNELLESATLVATFS